MRTSWFRLPIRWTMVAMVIVGLLCWLATTGVKVRQDVESRCLYHFVDHHGDLSDLSEVAHHAPFWPRFWRRLLSQPWPGTYRCGCPAVAMLAGDLTTFAGQVPAGTMADSQIGMAKARYYQFRSERERDPARREQLRNWSLNSTKNVAWEREAMKTRPAPGPIERLPSDWMGAAMAPVRSN